jgi:soluble lytic murein transglycosylase
VENRIDPRVAFGLVKTESEFKDRATSRVGAIGLTQLMVPTARWFKKGATEADLRDSRTNLRIGFRYLSELRTRYKGDLELALLAYNRGSGTVDRVLERGGDPNNGYVEKVLGLE